MNPYAAASASRALVRSSHALTRGPCADFHTDTSIVPSVDTDRSSGAAHNGARTPDTTVSADTEEQDLHADDQTRRVDVHIRGTSRHRSPILLTISEPNLAPPTARCPAPYHRSPGATTDRNISPGHGLSKEDMKLYSGLKSTHPGPQKHVFQHCRLRLVCIYLPSQQRELSPRRCISIENHYFPKPRYLLAEQ